MKVVEISVTTVNPAVAPLPVNAATAMFNEVNAVRLAEEQRQKEAEAQRKANIPNAIAESGVIGIINDNLVKRGWYSLLLHKDNTNSLNGFRDFEARIPEGGYFSEKYDLVPGVRNRELFDYIINLYRSAGYTIGGYGDYSANYWKIKELTISLPNRSHL